VGQYYLPAHNTPRTQHSLNKKTSRSDHIPRENIPPQLTDARRPTDSFPPARRACSDRGHGVAEPLARDAVGTALHNLMRHLQMQVRPPPSDAPRLPVVASTAVCVCLRVRVKIMGLIIIRTDCDFPTILLFCDPIISTRTRTDLARPHAGWPDGHERCRACDDISCVHVTKTTMMQGGAIVPQQLVPAHQRLDDLHRAVSYPQMPCTGIVDFVKRAGDTFEHAELLAVVRSMGGVELAEVLMRWRVGGGGRRESRLGHINIADTRETAARAGRGRAVSPSWFVSLAARRMCSCGLIELGLNHGLPAPCLKRVCVCACVRRCGPSGRGLWWGGLPASPSKRGRRWGSAACLTACR
jgi:hypothetical protein